VGLDYRNLKEVNPGIIHLHVSGYGSWGRGPAGRPTTPCPEHGGPGAHHGFRGPGSDQIGRLDRRLDHGPHVPPTPSCPHLNYRNGPGGQFIDYLQVENVIRFLDWTWLYSFKKGEDRKRSGNRDLAICPSDLFDCLDGRVALAAFSGTSFGPVPCHGPDGPPGKVPRSAASAERRERQELLAQVAAWAKERRVDEVEALACEPRVWRLQGPGSEGCLPQRPFPGARRHQEYEDSLYGNMVQQCYPP